MKTVNEVNQITIRIKKLISKKFEKEKEIASMLYTDNEIKAKILKEIENYLFEK
jgi:hypothetical protein